MNIILILLRKKLRYKWLSFSSIVTLLVSGRARLDPDPSVFASNPLSIVEKMAGHELALKIASSNFVKFLNF